MSERKEELSVVVDRNDKFLGYLPKSSCHADPNIIERIVGIVVLNSQDEILLQQRDPNKQPYPGMYTIAASGHVTSEDESTEAAAQRELSEEIGIKGSLRFLGRVHIPDPIHNEVKHFYLIRSDGPFRKEVGEVSDLRFLSIPDVKKMLDKCTPTVPIALELLAREGIDGKKA